MHCARIVIGADSTQGTSALTRAGLHYGIGAITGTGRQGLMLLNPPRSAAGPDAGCN